MDRTWAGKGFVYPTWLRGYVRGVSARAHAPGKYCGYALFEKVHDDGAFVQSAGRGVVVELQRRDEAFGRVVEERLWLLVGIDLVCRRRGR